MVSYRLLDESEEPDQRRAHDDQGRERRPGEGALSCRAPTASNWGDLSIDDGELPPSEVATVAL